MNTILERYDLVKEIRLTFDGIDQKIIGRLYEIVIGGLDYKYTWEINYYCRIPGEAETYKPGGQYSNNLQDIEDKFIKYAMRFENQNMIELNSSF